MDFTREPIIETIITPKEGCKLVVRSSKGAGQEEFIADAVEVVSFGRSTFYRSQERPKAFLVPVSDYEILEVREARMVLKNVGVDRAIKIGGGREPSGRGGRGVEKERPPAIVETAAPAPVEAAEEGASEARPAVEKKKDRRRQYRKRRGSQEQDKEEGANVEGVENRLDGEASSESQLSSDQLAAPAVPFSSLLEPPPALISETIGRYRENAMFKSAFFLTEEEQYKPHDKVDELLNEDVAEVEFTGLLQEPVYAESEDGFSSETDEELTLDEPVAELVEETEAFAVPDADSEIQPVEQTEEENKE